MPLPSSCLPRCRRNGAVTILKGAKRPLIILGKGAAYDQCDDLVRQFVERSGFPYLPMSMAKGLLPDTHPQSAAAARSTVLKDSDVVLMVGARLNWLLGHGQGKQWGEPHSKTFVQIDIDPKEMDSNVAISAPLVGDVELCLSALLDAMGKDWTKQTAWSDAIRAKVDANVKKMELQLQNNSNPSPTISLLWARCERSLPNALKRCWSTKVQIRSTSHAPSSTS